MQFHNLKISSEQVLVKTLTSAQHAATSHAAASAGYQFAVAGNINIGDLIIVFLLTTNL